MTFLFGRQGRRSSGRAGGQQKSWGQWKLIKNKKSLSVCLFRFSSYVDAKNNNCFNSIVINREITYDTVMKKALPSLWEGRVGNAPVILPLSGVPGGRLFFKARDELTASCAHTALILCSSIFMKRKICNRLIVECLCKWRDWTVDINSWRKVRLKLLI